MALLLFCVFAVSVFLPFYDYNRLKPEISRLVSEAVGRELIIDGNLEFKIGFEPRLIVSDIRFQNSAWGIRPAMAKVKRFELQLALLPLFKGRVEVRRCLFIHPDILIEMKPTGETNFPPDWFRVQKPGAPPKDPADKWEFSLAEFQIRDGHLVFADNRSKRNYHLDIEFFQLSSFASGQPARFRFKGSYGKLVLAAKGVIEAPRDSDWNSGLWKFQADLQHNASDHLSLEGILQGRRGRYPKVDFRFSFKTQDPTRLGAAIGFKAPRLGPLEAQGCLENEENAGERPHQLWRLDLDVKALEAFFRFKGLLSRAGKKAELDFDFRAEGRHLAHTLKIPEQEWLDQPFQMRGRLISSDLNRIYLSSVQARTARNDFEGVVEIDRSRKPLQLQAELHSQRVDLGPYFKKHGKEESAESGLQPRKVFTTIPFRLKWPELFEAHWGLKIEQLVFPQLVVQHATVGIAHGKNKLTVRLTGSAVSGGHLKGFLAIEPGEKKTAFHLSVTGRDLELGQMPKDLNLQKAIQGRLDLEARLQSQGQALADLAANLDGYTILTMKEGKINNKYIGRMGMDLATGLYALFNQPAEDEFIDIQCLVNRLDFEKGLTQVTVLLLETPAARIVGQGTVNLATEELDLKIRPLPKRGLGAKGFGRISLSLGSLAKPFKLSGTLAKPKLALDPAQTFLTVGKFIGAAAAFGFAGLAVVLFSTSYDEADACQNAVRLARQGPKKAKSSDQPKIMDSNK